MKSIHHRGKNPGTNIVSGTGKSRGTKNRRAAAALIIFLISAGSVISQDWPQYLGPQRNGTSPQKGILRSWPAKGPEILWTANIGIGYGGTVVRDGRVYLLDRDDRTGDRLRCFDLSSGRELWSVGYDAPGTVQFPGSRSVPAIDGNRIYTCGPYGHLYCIDINTRKPLWNKNIWTDFGGGEIPRWAISQCPLVYGNLLIVASQAPEAGVVAYDKLSGSVRWTTASLGPVGYVSPALLKAGTQDHVVMITASAGRGPSASGGKVAGIDPLTGKILWEYDKWQCGIPVPCAIDAGEGRVLITGGYQAGAAMLKISRKSDGSFEVTELFKNPDFGAHTQPPVLHNGYFYAQYSTNERKDGLVCMSMDGQVKWSTRRSPAFDKGGMILAEGLLLSTDGSNRLYLIQPDPSAFRALASAEILSPGGTGTENDPVASRVGGATQNWAPLALSDGRLIIRDQKRLICVRVAK
ncbi:MAG TPA: PQQ-like beta-propeller repeat protein [Bacteroidales bacterium]|nr:PQQ-like beta-propeller repeat protein [Bacteroidales bacterium]HOS71713.1 PQQ-like beta-propeller repeat protein [Bacteroidales bacterium]HQH24001.1 PQQ-like beta-propeller repeat protein [Bacteroidales bacterium]HQJ82224.1 PQQ-like beta-propeller repeat protein [Bacteroidales bacterium]